jgi:tyrosinase
MSGNGAFDPNYKGFKFCAPPFPCRFYPPYGGGGCVTTGPFANMTVNLGPIGLSTQPNTTGLEYNPCLRRNLRREQLADASPNLIEDLTKKHTDIESFQRRLEGRPDESPGLHSAGHSVMGGDPADDLAVSPGDPMFFMHHAGIDQVWWRWQNLDLKERQYAIAFTKTILNNPPSENLTLDDVIQLGILAPPVKIRELMSPTDRVMCYRHI